MYTWQNEIQKICESDLELIELGDGSDSDLRKCHSYSELNRNSTLFIKIRTKEMALKVILETRASFIYGEASHRGKLTAR